MAFYRDLDQCTYFGEEYGPMVAGGWLESGHDCTGEPWRRMAIEALHKPSTHTGTTSSGTLYRRRNPAPSVAASTCSDGQNRESWPERGRLSTQRVVQ
jgi:hypothetical protein